MTYVSLYRKWRPRVFTDVVGQEHVVRTLTNALDQKRIGHAYLFAGPRGTGKTTLARLLAKGLNCTLGPTGSPCGDCERCLRIAEGSSVDVLEIDGASNRGIDEIREIRERVKYAPAEGGYKVYIIDEVHMLTTEAFNALLKVLEEPPKHVVFIFATTEQHKIPATILSRCQNFEFRSLSAVEILEQLNRIAQGEGAEVETEALALIARHAEGGMRDAIGFLDQSISFSDGKIDSDLVAEVLGVVRTESLEALADALVEKDLKRCLVMVKDSARSGYDIRQWTADAARYFRDLMLLALLPDETDMLPLTDEARKRGIELANRLGVTRLVEIVERFGMAESDMRDAPSPILVLELAMIELVNIGVGSDVQALTERIAVLESRLGSQDGGMGAPFIPTTPATPVAPGRATPPPFAAPRTELKPNAQSPAEDGQVTGKKTLTEDDVADQSSPPVRDVSSRVPTANVDQPERSLTPDETDLVARVRQVWPDLLEALRTRKAMQQAAFLREGVPGAATGDTVTIFFSPNHQFHQANIEAEQNKMIVETELSKLIGRDVKIKPESGSPPRIAQSEVTQSNTDKQDGETSVQGKPSAPVEKQHKGTDRTNEEVASHDDIMAKALEEPLVKAALDIFGGTITKIERKDDETS